MYEFGMAVPQSRANAIAWFGKAAAQGTLTGRLFLMVPERSKQQYRFPQSAG
jgi:hypothetical protein